MRIPALPPTAFSIVRRDIAEARAQATEARTESAKYKRAIEAAIDLLRAEPRDGFRARLDRAVMGLRVALVV
ncbi:MAG TPA: hypothetical protein VK595_09540 [Vicinamibacterales bacterium]|nr:hypothetical protein [Vicinamibacterales bacterium]